MISKIISRAACLRELASNPKSFSNCPDLHGGVPNLPEDRICTKLALGKTGRPAGNFSLAFVRETSCVESRLSEKLPRF
jgi:hypothetical protein